MRVWKILDAIVNGSVLIAAGYFYGWKVFLIGLFLVIWNFTDGYFRAKKPRIQSFADQQIDANPEAR